MMMGKNRRTRKQRMNVKMINMINARDHFDIDVILHDNSFWELVSCNVWTSH